MQPEGTVAACGADLAFMLDLLPVTEVILRVFKAGGECAKVDWSVPRPVDAGLGAGARARADRRRHLEQPATQRPRA